MTSTSDSRTKAWLSKPAVRLVAAFAVILGPAAAAPILLSGGVAHADESPLGCYNGRQVVSPSIDGPAGTATVELEDATADPNPLLCNTVALVAYYYAPDPTANTQGQYPQREATAKFYTVTSTDPITISLPTNKCYAQLDLIYGIAQDGSSTVIPYLTGPTYSAEGILLNHQDFTPPVDCTPPPPTPTCSTTTTVTVTATTTDSTEPSTSSSVTPPECTTTTTAPPPTPTCSTTTTVTVTATSTDSTEPSTSSSVTPPECTTTSTVPPSSSTSTVPPSSSTSTVPPSSPTTTSVLGTSTSKAPSSSSTSPVFSTSVLPFSTSKAPTPPGTLPFTGSNAPVKSGVLVALGLISAGGGLVLFAGRRRRAGGHRVG